MSMTRSIRPGRGVITQTWLDSCTASSIDVGDEDHGRPLAHPQRLQVGADALARHGVELAERLVEQQRVGLVDHRLAEGGALLHAARQLVRVAVVEAVELDRARAGSVIRSA